jgi:hypothetical protein
MIPPDRRSIIAGRTARHRSVSAPQLRSTICRRRSGSALVEPPVEAEAGIVDQQLYGLAGLRDVAHQLRRGAWPAEVDFHRAGVAELRCKRIEPLLAPGGQHQPVAAPGQAAGQTLPQAPPKRR